MIVYRLTKAKYKKGLSGRGAELNGGRWNSKGYSLIYTGASRALCTTEIAVHTPLGIVPVDYWLQSIELPDIQELNIHQDDLATDWNSFPHRISTKMIGNEFIQQSQYLVMKVPSAVIQDEFNYLINPSHPDFARVKLIKVEEFKFDHRLFKR